MELDNPVWSALTGPQAAFAIGHGRAARYPADVSPFAAVADPADPGAWADLAQLAGVDTIAVVSATDAIPAGWKAVRILSGYQMTEKAADGEGPEDGLDLLGVVDADAMLDLVERTEPGPFARRTVQLGRYLGVHDGDALVAMAGERVATGGWREVSAVCTDPPHRGRGHARRLIAAVRADIHRRGERAFLHVMATNPAVALYRDLGFEIRAEVHFLVMRAV